MLTEEQRGVLRRDFEILLPLALRFGIEVHEQFAELDPRAEPLRGAELDRRAAELIQGLNAGLVHLIDEGDIAEGVRRLGLQLRADGVLGRDFDTFGRALDAVFERRLGDDLTPEGRDAWRHAWELLSIEMQRAAIAAEEE